MKLIPASIREHLRKAFVGRTLDEVVEELRKRRIAKVSLSGDFIRASDSVIDSSFNFYVDYSAETVEGDFVSFREFAGSRYSQNQRGDSNQDLNHRKEVLQQEFGPIGVKVNYLSEKDNHYLKPSD